MQALSPAPYPLVTGVEVDHVSLLQRPDLLKTHEQTLNMVTGELSTQMSFNPGKEISLELEVLQFAYRSVPALLCQEIRITPSSNVRASITTQIGIKGVPDTVYRYRPPEQTEIDLVMGFRSHRELSERGAAAAVLPQPGIQRTGEPLSTNDGVTREYHLDGKGGRTYRFQTIAAMVSHRRIGYADRS